MHVSFDAQASSSLVLYVLTHPWGELSPLLRPFWFTAQVAIVFCGTSTPTASKQPVLMCNPLARLFPANRCFVFQNRARCPGAEVLVRGFGGIRRPFCGGAAGVVPCGVGQQTPLRSRAGWSELVVGLTDRFFFGDLFNSIKNFPSATLFRQQIVQMMHQNFSCGGWCISPVSIVVALDWLAGQGSEKFIPVLHTPAKEPPLSFM